jgi:hypothetical protein
MDFAGPEALRKHWRYLVARWAAWPVVWCVAGEALMDYYVGQPATDPGARREEQRRRWSELLRFIRATDPYRNPITIHASQAGYVPVEDPRELDLAWLSTGHDGYPTLADTIDVLESTREQGWKVPVIPAEVSYEGILESSREEVQRFLFWSTILGGAAGLTYGANGIWQVNRKERPYGPSPHGVSWGDTPWDEAYRLPGSTQVGVGRRILQRFPWWELEPHPEWVDPHQHKGSRYSCYAAGIPGRVLIIFFPHTVCGAMPHRPLRIHLLEPDAPYRGAYINPSDGTEHPLGEIRTDPQGCYVPRKPPIFRDWVLVLERA